MNHQHPQYGSNGFPVCQRCGGQIMDDPEGVFCLQCGADHTDNYSLIQPIREHIMELHFCPRCRSPVIRWGFHKVQRHIEGKKQRYYCNNCNYLTSKPRVFSFRMQPIVTQSQPVKR